MTDRVGVVGLGAMGGPMAHRLLATRAPGDEVWVADSAPAAVAPLTRAGARPASVAQLGEAVDVACVVVRDDTEVSRVAGELALAAAPPVVVVHSTVAPETSSRLAAEHPGLRLVDAPVSGGVGAAASGQLAVMVGADPADLEVCARVLARLGSLVTWVGPLGAGTRVKLARNLVQYVSFCAAAEAQRLVVDAGLDPLDLAEVMRHTDAITGGPGALVGGAGGHLGRDHLTALGHKDLDLALRLADGLGLELPLTRLARERVAGDLTTLLASDPS